MDQGTATLLLERTHVVGEIPGEIVVAAGQKISQALCSHRVVFRQPVIALVNGQTCDVSYFLQPGDVVRFLPQIAGG